MVLQPPRDPRRQNSAHRLAMAIIDAELRRLAVDLEAVQDDHDLSVLERQALSLARAKVSHARRLAA
jgi:hypothetical protein